VAPLEKWLQTSGSADTPLGRIVSEVKAREERWLGVQERLTADVTSTAERLRQKTLSVETLEATLQADPGFRDWAKEIRRLRQQVRTSDSKLQERENDLRVAKEKSLLEKAELEAALRDAKTGDIAEKLKVQAEVRCCARSSPLLLLLLLFRLCLWFREHSLTFGAMCSAQRTPRPISTTRFTTCANKCSDWSARTWNLNERCNAPAPRVPTTDPRPSLGHGLRNASHS
jgi:hypothetical protein